MIFRNTFFFVLIFSLFTFYGIKDAGATAPASFADLVEALSPAVVNVSTMQVVKQEETDGSPFKVFPPGHPFEDFNDFFERFGAPRGGGKATSLGSGFVISEDGLVVTNNHVIEEADEIQITFSDDDTKYIAEVVGRDAKTDLAVLRIKNPGKKFPYVKFGDSDKARVGDWVVAIGNPFGLGGTVTAGIISARARDINSGPYDDFIQTDASINRGNSGGPMFNVDGEVIGINTAIYSPSGGSVGIGFAIPSAMAKTIIEQLKQGKEIKRGWLGVKIQTVTEDIAESLGLDSEEGALVVEVTEDSPADDAGLTPGDVIVSFNGKVISAMRKLPRMVAATDVGNKVDLVVWREGKKKKLTVKIGELKEEKRTPKVSRLKEDDKELDRAKKILGIHVLPIDDEIRKQYDLGDETHGLFVVDVAANSAAAERGIRRGDVIVEANQQKTGSTADFSDAVEKARKQGRKSVLILVDRAGNNIFIALPAGEEGN